MVGPDQTFRNILKEEFEERSNRNSNYSLRAFARDLGVSPSRLSEVFSEKMGLSRHNADKIAKRLGYSESETEIFLALVDAEHGRGKAIKKKAREKLNALKAAPEYELLRLDSFKIISDWYHYAILDPMCSGAKRMICVETQNRWHRHHHKTKRDRRGAAATNAQPWSELDWQLPLASCRRILRSMPSQDRENHP